MALSVTAALVDDASGWDNTPPAGHAGWNNTAGDDVWVPDRTYYRRVLLELTGDAGEKPNIVNWEIYGNDFEFVADASAVTVQAAGGDYTGATAPAYLNDLTTRTIWVRNATAADGGAPYYDDTGSPWVSSLRANGNRVVVEFPFYSDFAAANTETADFLVEAFLPGSFGSASASAIVALANPDEAVFV